MSIFVQKPITNSIEAKQWPDNGVEQFEVAKWAEENGCKLGLYDGCVEQGNFYNGVKWRWRSASLPDKYKSVGIGDWIVFDGADFDVVTTATLHEKYKQIA